MKVSQTSVKISKKEKKELSSLIRLLKPKVYITDSSSFKMLVQDLTGKGSSNISITTSSSHPKIQQHRVLVEEEEIPVVNIEEDQGEPQGSTSVDVSTDASLDTSELFNQDVLLNDQELNQICYQTYSDTITTTTTLEGSNSTVDQLVDMLPFQDLESWLLGTEPFDSFNNSYTQIFQEFSGNDYDLSGIL